MHADNLVQTHQGSEVGMAHRSQPVLGQDGLAFISPPSVIGCGLPCKRCDLGRGSSLQLRQTLKELTVACDKSFHERGAGQFISVSIKLCRWD